MRLNGQTQSRLTGPVSEATLLLQQAYDISVTAMGERGGLVLVEGG